jgi:DNA polymerase I-like protein with 3'-5' exonuclease and polymerase domains
MMNKDDKPKPFSVPPEWIPPQEVPNLSDAEMICIDVETCDPNIKTLGPGYCRQDGYVAGIAIAVDGWKGYFPIRHEGGGNFDLEIIRGPLQKIFASDAPKLFHNSSYDMGWLEAEGFTLRGRIHDTMIMAPLIDENRRYFNLNSLGYDYCGETKNESALYEAAAEFGVDAKAEMYKLPPMYVGGYAEQDTVLTLKLYERLKHEIEKEECGHICELETDLIPLTYAMKKKGVCIDEKNLELLESRLLSEEKKILKQIKSLSGKDIEIWAAASVAKAFDALDIPYERTPKSNAPSFAKNFLSTHTHELPQLVVKCREINKARTTFIETIKKHTYKGKIHAEINQLRSEKGGTVSGRMSYSNPNLQQMPARNKYIADLIKNIFIPEEGKKWHVFDYSQQEPRILVHYALSSKGGLTGSDRILQQYNSGQEVDFHQMVADMASISRDEAKSINLGIMYGMGKGKMAIELGLDIHDAEIILNKYHKTVPFVKELQEIASRTASKHGHIRTLLGRKCRFPLWEPNRWGISKPLPREEAEIEYGNDIRRAFTFKSLNRLIQGSAADQTKKAMLDLYHEGFIPEIAIHDEVDISLENSQQVDKVKEIMENCVEKLKVPSMVNERRGMTWGEAGK